MRGSGSASMQGITRVPMWGGTVFEEGAAQGLVEQCDYVYTRLLPGPTGARVAFVAGRKLG
ncbi:hypothetical protein [Mesorhizobium sp. M1A.F.Ca.ET.072.01.1.1]|uniref:hypothetical protein n=2 Tax=unclassified Mesorhizobium TaxID=325217 RepID=UPI0016784E90|nr:hypothetical protein [Mesorhizobium sp. M1A.F.Ca.ET.072.01.1.1]